jgi:hypothetical protein
MTLNLTSTDLRKASALAGPLTLPDRGGRPRRPVARVGDAKSAAVLLWLRRQGSLPRRKH